MPSSITSDRQRRTQERDLPRRSQPVTGRPRWEAWRNGISDVSAQTLCRRPLRLCSRTLALQLKSVLVPYSSRTGTFKSHARAS